MTTTQEISELWCTRCPVPTPLGLAVQLDWFTEEFGRDGIALRSIQETSDPNARELHFDHNLPRSFRQGGNIPAIWARANGRDTRVIGLSWTDEFQAILTLPGSGIRRARDLRGRRIGLPVNPISIDFNRASALRGFAKALELDGLSLDAVERIDTVNDAANGVDGIATVSHVHTPYLGAWSQSHRALPIRYVPVQRWTRARELPIYIDRRQGEANFILEVLAEDPQVPAILEVNGGSTAWGRKGLLALANYIVLPEEGARLQALAETLGGSQDYGPGVLEQQWKMSGLIRETDRFEEAIAAE